MELAKKDYDKILDRLCKAVGIEYKKFFKPYLYGKSMPDKWYMMHSWTEKEQGEFGKWLMSYLLKLKPRMDKILAKKYVSYFALDYGWTTKQDK